MRDLAPYPPPPTVRAEGPEDGAEEWPVRICFQGPEGQRWCEYLTLADATRLHARLGELIGTARASMHQRAGPPDLFSGRT